MADDRTHRSTNPLSPPAPIAARQEGPRTVISKRQVPQPEPVAPLGSSVQELGQSLIGKQLGHFQVESFIGGGGMGAVFRGADLKLGRTVAIKVLSKDRTDEDTIRRFQNEAQSAARLDHPNIARVYYVGEDLGWNYIVFEFIDGQNIRDLVESRGPLPLDEVVPYMLQVAEALDHASRRDVVHRDIKPSNVLVMPDGRVKLVDMGLARLHQVEASNADLTATGVTLGTFDYISPEQARDPRSADVRSDLYSLGCTMFYMLTGQPPFPGGTVLQKLLSHSSDPPPDLRSFRQDLPDDVCVVLERLLAKQPAHRYQTASELIGALLLLADEIGLKGVASSTELVVSPVSGTVIAQRQLPWLVPVALLFVIVVALQLIWSQSPDGLSSRPRPVYAAPRTDGGTLAKNNTRPETPGTTAKSDDTPGTRIETSEGNEPTVSRGAGTNVEATPRGPAATTKLSPGKTGEDSKVGGAGASPASTGSSEAVSPKTPRRLIVTTEELSGTLDAATRVSPSFQEAVEFAVAEPTVESIELRWQGEMVADDCQIDLQGRRLTIRAASGYRPTIVFRPSLGETPRDRRMLRVAQSSLAWEGIGLTFVLPVEPYDDWALFALDRASSLELGDCVITVRNSGKNGVPVNRVACVEWSRLTSPEMASADRPARPTPPPLLALRNSIVRGQASLVQALDNIPFRLTWNQGLFASTESMVVARGANEQPAVTDGLHIELQNVTVAVSGAMCQMQMDNDHRFPWTCVCRLVNCILLKSAGASLDGSQSLAIVEQRFAAPVEPVRKRPFISGTGNYYPPETLILKVDAAGSVEDSVTYSLLDRDRARDEKWYDEQPTLGMVMWTKLPIDQPVDAQSQRDYVLDTTAQNPARAAGFDPALLPDPDSASATNRDKPADPPSNNESPNSNSSSSSTK